MSESCAELKAKVLQQKEQLAQVDALLAQDPGNAQFVKLRDDLSKLIDLTERLHEEALESERYAEKKSVLEGSSDRLASDWEDVPPVAPQGALSTSILPRVPQENPVAIIPVAEAAHISSAAALGVGPIEPGDVVSVSGGDRPYAAYVTKVLNASDADGNTTVRVKYYEYDAEVELSLTSVTRLPEGPINASNRASLASGHWRGQCKFAQDQLYYNVAITEVTAHGARVTYTDFGNTEEVPLSFLRPNKEKSHKVSTEDLMDIPDKYRVKDTDTEQERHHKLKKQKAIKHKNREITKDLEVAAVQKSWQKFVSRGNKRNLAGMKRSTIFAEQEGQMTENLKRKKHKFA